METVTVWRGTETTDADGNPVQGSPAQVSTWEALVADEHFAEPAEVGRASILVGAALYILDQGPTGILPSDSVEVRGQRLPVNGHPAVWHRWSGGHWGDVVTLERKEG